MISGEFIFRDQIELASDDAIINIWPVIAARMLKIAEGRRADVRNLEVRLAMVRHDHEKQLSKNAGSPQ